MVTQETKTTAKIPRRGYVRISSPLVYYGYFKDNLDKARSTVYTSLVAILEIIDLYIDE